MSLCWFNMGFLPGGAALLIHNITSNTYGKKCVLVSSTERSTDAGISLLICAVSDAAPPPLHCSVLNFAIVGGKSLNELLLSSH